ncbi:MAG: response regulator [Aestuariivirga sp.]
MAVILLVEDDLLIRNCAEMMIQDGGHTTLAASDVAEALAFIDSSQHIDALMTDIRLKTAINGGYELARQAIQRRPSLRVLYATGSSITDKIKALCVDGAHFIQKPYSEEQLRQSVDELLAVSS